jgi:hypothetical protein
MGALASRFAFEFSIKSPDLAYGAAGGAATGIAFSLADGERDLRDLALSGMVGGLARPPIPPAPENLSFEQLLSKYADRLTVEGQTVTRRELDFAGVSPKQVADALSGAAPLGTTPAQWAALQSDLTIAMRESGLEGVQLDRQDRRFASSPGAPSPFRRTPMRRPRRPRRTVTMPRRLVLCTMRRPMPRRRPRPPFLRQSVQTRHRSQE